LFLIVETKLYLSTKLLNANPMSEPFEGVNEVFRGVSF